MRIFSMKNIFRKILKIENFKKSLFRKILKNEKSTFPRKSHIFSMFQKFREKKMTFLVENFRSFFEKVNIFENFRNRYFFENIFLIEKKVLTKSFYFFIFLSYLKSSSCKWHRATPSVPPVRAANALPKSRKTKNILPNPKIAT